MTPRLEKRGRFSKITTRMAVSMLLGIMGVTCLLSLRLKTATVDEFAHLPAGYYYWKTGDFSLYGKNPPLIRIICALPLLAMDISMDPARSYEKAGDWRPWVFGTYFMKENAQAYDTIFFVGRIPVVLLALLLGVYVFLWAKDLYGPRGGLVALLAYTFSPNILAHSRLVTTDLGCTCFMFLATYYYWKSRGAMGALQTVGDVRSEKRSGTRWEEFQRKGGLGADVKTGVFLGLALLSKFSALLLIPVFFLLSLANALLEGIRWTREDRPAVPRRSRLVMLFRDWMPDLLLVVFVATVVINLGYGFTGSFKSLRTIPHRSGLLERLDRFPLNAIPIPLPEAYIRGFDGQKLDAEQGEFLNYLRGELSAKGWWYYFLYALLIKTPIALQAAFLLALWLGIKKRLLDGTRGFLAVPIAAVLLFFSFFNHLQVGLRYVLPIFPFLFVWVGRLGQARSSKPLLRWLGVALVLGYVVSSVSLFPDYLAYFNAWVGGPGQGCHHLLDSNLDWGQDLERLKGYMERNQINEVGLAYFGHVDPQLYGISYHLLGDTPEAGPVAISANYLGGLPYLITYAAKPMPIKPNAFSWLRAYKPTAHIGHTIYIYDISLPPSR